MISASAWNGLGSWLGDRHYRTARTPPIDPTAIVDKETGSFPETQFQVSVMLPEARRWKADWTLQMRELAKEDRLFIRHQILVAFSSIHMLRGFCVPACIRTLGSFTRKGSLG